MREMLNTSEEYKIKEIEKHNKMLETLNEQHKEGLECMKQIQKDIQEIKHMLAPEMKRLSWSEILWSYYIPQKKSNLLWIMENFFFCNLSWWKTVGEK